MGYLWTTFLYNPLLNALVALYSNFAGQNLGIAIIELVVVIRIFMLPLTVISERARARYESLREKLSQVEDMYKNDPIAKKEMMRKLLERNKIKPWAKAMVLSVLFVVLIILYWVFLVAVSDNDFTGLYSWNRAPDFLDTNFLGFDLNARSFIWAFAVALLVHLSIWSEQSRLNLSLDVSGKYFDCTLLVANGKKLVSFDFFDNYCYYCWRSQPFCKRSGKWRWSVQAGF